MRSQKRLLSSLKINSWAVKKDVRKLFRVSNILFITLANHIDAYTLKAALSLLLRLPLVHSSRGERDPEYQKHRRARGELLRHEASFHRRYEYQPARQALERK